MSFINTIDSLSDEVAFKRLLERGFEEFQDDELKIIGPYGLAGSKKLTYINLPNVTEMRIRAFTNCDLLTDAVFPSVISIDQSFRDCKNLRTVNMPNLQTMGVYTFSGCSSLENVSVPKVTDVGAGCFERCIILKKIDFPSLVNIASRGLSNCMSLTQFIIRSTTVATMGNSDCLEKCYHFLGTVQPTYNPEGLKDGYIYVPSSLVDSYKAATNWSVYADRFRALEDYTYSCTLEGPIFTEIVPEMYSEEVTVVGDARFQNNTTIVSVDLPNVTELKNSAFRDCSSLKTANVPLLTTIGNYSFMRCALEEANFPRLTTTGIQCFYGNPFTNVTLQNVTQIKSQTFGACYSLEFVDLPKCVEIMSQGFYMAKSLHTLVLRSETICSLANTNAFVGNTESNNSQIYKGTGYIYVPKALVEEYKTATNWSTFANQFRALEDYTVDGTITGELDESKI